MACAEQPIKKRRLYETIPESQPPPPHLESASPSTLVSSFPAPVTPPPPSQEEIQTRSRNREEIRRVHECYKRLKSCIGQRDSRRSASLEQAYRSLISASRGLVSSHSYPSFFLLSLPFDSVLPIGWLSPPFFGVGEVRFFFLSIWVLWFWISS